MPELVGVLAVNDQLQRATKLDFAGKLVGAESFAVDKNGKREQMFWHTLYVILNFVLLGHFD